MDNSIQTNIAHAAAAREKVRAHPMAYDIKETASKLLVIFPMGYQLDGVQVSLANGKAWAYEKALEKMELTWKAA